MLVFLWSAKVALSILGYVHEEVSAPVKNACVAGLWVEEMNNFFSVDLMPCVS